jgi:hypothetical protein
MKKNTLLKLRNQFSKKIVSSVLLSFCLLFMSSIGVKAQCTFGNIATVGYRLYTHYPGESFKPTCNGLITDIKMNTNPINTATAGILTIYTGIGNTGSLIGQESYSVSVASDGYFTIHLATPIAVIANNSYTYFLNITNLDTYEFAVSLGQSYPDGHGFEIYNGVSNSLPYYFIFSIVIAPPCSPNTSTNNQTICATQLPYNWNGLTFNGAGTQTTHLTNVGGCDSAATLNLSIHTPTSSTNTVSACNSYLWNGTTYNSSGTYVHTTQGSSAGGGCGSIDSLVLIVKHSSASNTNMSICNSLLPYNWNGLTFNSAGSQTAHLTNAAGCDSAATLNLTIKPSPSIGISSGATICTIGGTASVYNSNPSGGGLWTSNNTSVATITTTNIFTGIVTAVSNGTSILTFTKTGSNGCTSTASATVIVAAIPTPAPITGPSSVCVGSSITLSDITPSGTWTSIAGRATINNSGIVTGTSAGIATIRYTVSNLNGCSSYVSKNITVYAIPAVPSIAYAPGTINPQSCGGGGFRKNNTFTVIGSPIGGIWSSTGVITVGTTTGIVNTGAVDGVASLIYTYTNSNACSNSRTITGSVGLCRSINNIVPAFETDKEFTLFPNPTHSSFTININTLVGSGDILVTDLSGKQVKIQALSMGNNIIDISYCSKGIYLITLITNNSTITKRLVVE